MRQGREVVVHGDGTSLWTLTHHDGLRPRRSPACWASREALGEAFHITSDEAPTWNQIYCRRRRGAPASSRGSCTSLRRHRGRRPRPRAPALLGDKAHSMVFDNSKVKAPGPRAGRPRSRSAQGAREIVAWHDADPARRVVDARLDALFDRLVEAYRPRPLA